MPNKKEIAHQQKLLTMYRGLLAENLRQRELWDRTEIPAFLRTGVEVIRKHILETKGTLRGWKVDVADQPDDEGETDRLAGEVQHQRELLKIHGANLAIYLKQQEQFSVGQAPPMVIHSINHTRNEIQRIKAILRGWGVPVEDQPEEEVT